MKLEEIKKLMAEGWSLRRIGENASGFRLVEPNGNVREKSYVSMEQAKRLNYGVLEKFLAGDSVRTIFFSLRDAGRQPNTGGRYYPTQVIEKVIRNEIRELQILSQIRGKTIENLDRELRANEMAVVRGG